MGYVINKATDYPRLGATNCFQKMVDGQIVDLTKKEAMNTEIQDVNEKIFLLAHSTNVTTSSLAETLGYLSDTEISNELLSGGMNVPEDLDDMTTLVLDDICRLGMELRNKSGEEFIIILEEFKYFWRAGQ